MVLIKNEESLLEQLLQDIDNCGKGKIVLQAGHFPLIYRQNSDVALEGIRQWGEFSPYTLELACRVGRFAKDVGKIVKFVFFVDDHSYLYNTSLNRTQTRKQRQRLYSLRSGSQAELVGEYNRIMRGFGFSEDDVLRQEQGKVGRKNCLYFSELVLRAGKRSIDNACAREYVEFIESPYYFKKRNSHLISFVPQRCRGHICDIALDDEIEGLSASHVFMETMAVTATREQLYSVGRGITYRRN